MMIDKLFNECPIWVLLLITLFLLFAAFEVGFFLGRSRRKRKGDGLEISLDPMLGATLGLLAFMLAFSFGVAAAHFNTRRHLVLDEANAIRSVYVQSSLMDQASCVRSRDLFRSYVDIRLEDIQSLEQVDEVLGRSSVIYNELWKIAVDTEKSRSGAPSSWLYVSALAKIAEVQASRVSYGSRGRISPTIWSALYWLAGLSMLAMGYRAGWSGMRGFIAYLIFIGTFSLVLVLISDLDRPRQTGFKINDADMLRLRQMMDVPDEGFGGMPDMNGGVNNE